MDGIVIDSFAGGGGASLGIEQALGRSPDIAINHDAEAIAMHQANHPATLHYSNDVWKVDPREAVKGRKVALAWFSPDCFPAGTLILTRQGYRPIEEIEIGEEVLTHKLRWKRVTESSMSHRPMVCLRGHGHPGIVSSVEHPFLARQRKDVWSTDPRGYRRTLDPQDWIPASMLDKGWYWAAPVKFPEAEVPPVGGRGFCIDLRLMWLIGRYLGDGWTRLTDSRAELVITCGKHEAENLRDRLSVWPREGERSLSPFELSWNERPTGTAYQFTANHRGLVEWLREHFRHRAEAKRLPAWVLGLSPAMKASLLEGYLSADGWRGEDFTEARTVSKALAFSMKALINSLGKTVTVNLLPNQSEIEGRQVNARPIYLLRWRHQPSPTHVQTFQEEDIEWSPIREQTDLAVSEDVYNIGVEEDESYVAEGLIVHNCKHFSKAKGGKPVARNIRDLAWVVVHWAKQVRPAVIMLENVEEFRTWGPLDENDMPCPRRKGHTFNRWVGKLKALGYIVAWRELRACDYGAPTIRKRLFLIARCDGKPIVWPESTHGPAGSLFSLKPYRTAAECINWSLPCPSIFLTKEQGRAIGVNRPLAEATMARIAKGVKRYVLDAAQPFIVNLTHHGSDRTESLAEPFKTITGANRGEKAVVVPVMSYAQQGGASRAADEPLHTLTASVKDQNQVIVPTLVGCGGRAAQSRARGLDEPTATITSKADACVVAAFLAQHNLGMVGHDVRKPISTITQRGTQQALVAAHMLAMKGSDQRSRPADAPLGSVTAQGTHHAEVRAFLMKYYGTDQAPELREPLHTVTSKDRFGLVMVHGEPYQIVDIGMRMLSPRELFRAQGFPDTYRIEVEHNGRILPKTAQIRMCGNSVSPVMARALVEANLAGTAEQSRRAA